MTALPVSVFVTARVHTLSVRLFLMSRQWRSRGDVLLRCVGLAVVPEHGLRVASGSRRECEAGHHRRRRGRKV